MYRISPDLDLSPIVGEFMTQVCVGQFDIQFSLGSVEFMVQSEIQLTQYGSVIGTWGEGRWPDAAFYNIMNVKVTGVSVPSDREILITLENEVNIHLRDSFDQYESMQISVRGSDLQWII